jgi:hypothetical protein
VPVIAPLIGGVVGSTLYTVLISWHHSPLLPLETEDTERSVLRVADRRTLHARAEAPFSGTSASPALVTPRRAPLYQQHNVLVTSNARESGGRHEDD